MKTLTFTSADKMILRKGLLSLSLWERQILIYRFWENFTIEEIANFYGTSWSEMNLTIERLQKELRSFCLDHPEFSLTDVFKVAA